MAAGVATTPPRKTPPAPNSLQRVGLTQSDVTYRPPSPSSQSNRDPASNASRRTSTRQSGDLSGGKSTTSRPQHRRLQSQPQMNRPISVGQNRQGMGTAAHHRSGSSVQPDVALQRTTSGQLSQSKRLDRNASRSIRPVNDLQTPSVSQRLSGRGAPPGVRVTSTSQRSQAPPSVSETRPSGTHTRAQSQLHLNRSLSVQQSGSQSGRIGSHQRSNSNIQGGASSSGVLQQSRRLNRELSRKPWRP